MAQSGLYPAVGERDSSLSGLVEVILNFRTVHSWPRENVHPCPQSLSERHLGTSSGWERLAHSKAMDLLVCRRGVVAAVVGSDQEWAFPAVSCFQTTWWEASKRPDSPCHCHLGFALVELSYCSFQVSEIAVRKTTSV